MKIIIKITLVVILLAAGFAAGFPVGQSVGFSTGSEWALVQADIIAREAGMVMPVNFSDGQFKVVHKQPRDLHKTAWKLADLHEADMAYANTGRRTLGETVQLSKNMYMVQ